VDGFCQKNSAKQVLEFKSQGTRLRQFLLVSEGSFYTLKWALPNGA
jgi:hypothetical protein